MLHVREGGAIDVGLVDEVAVLFMIWWDKQLLQKLHDYAYITQLCSWYADDINTENWKRSDAGGPTHCKLNLFKYISHCQLPIQ